MESKLIRNLRRRLPPHRLLCLGPGDDAAVLSMANAEECVVTVDLLMDQVDFELDKIDVRRAGRKALAVNLSDIAAMAAKPIAAVIALALPRSGGLDLATKLYDGILPLAETYDVAIAGGDTNSWDGPLAISVTLIGSVTENGTMRRSGAKSGDKILVTGSFGGSILGRHLDFEPRVNEALRLNERYDVHAGIDVSDGLSVDLLHIIEESGCGALVDVSAVPVSKDAERLAERLGNRMTPLQHALTDGEDFELILAVPPSEAIRLLADQSLGMEVAQIGEFVDDLGMWKIDESGERAPMIPMGYQHRFD